MAQTSIWHGDGTTNAWSVGGPANFQRLSGSTFSAISFAQGDNVLFDDSGSNTPAVNISGNLTPGAVTVNASQAYTLGGTGTLSGAMTLIKSGTGTLTLSGANTYTGATQVNGGTLTITGTLSNTGGTITVGNAAILNIFAATITTTTLHILSGGTLSGTGAITGTVSVDTGGVVTTSSALRSTFTGAGLVTINTAGNTFTTGNANSFNGFSGTLNLNSTGVGKLALNATGQNFGNGATVNINSGSTLYMVSGTTISGTTFNLTGTGNTENLGALRLEGNTIGATSTVNLLSNTTIGGNITYSAIMGTITGNGFGFTKVASNTFFLSGANTFTGTTSVSAGLLNLSNPLALQYSTLAANSAFTNSGIIFSSTVSGNAFTLGGLTGSGNLALQNDAPTPAAINLLVGNNGLSTTYSGVLSGSGSLVKVGAGTLVLSGFNTYAGSTTISGGTLRLKAPPILPTGLQIMPVGDSITFGSHGTNGGYRGPLYNLIKNIAPAMLFVGSSIQGDVTVTGDQMLPTDQRHNEGHSSYTISDINNNLDGLDTATFIKYGGPDRDPNGGHWLDGIADTSNPNYRLPLYPDIITLMIGTNNATDVDRAAVQTQLHALITKITTMRPNTNLIVAQITPSNRPNNVSYNAAVASEVTSFQAAGKLVSLVDMYTNFPAGGLSGDIVHPNDTGYNFMANQWYDGILAVVSPTGKGVSSSIPAASPVTVATGATFDLDGGQAAISQISGNGTIMLGSGGILTAINSLGSDTTFSGPISGSGNLIKTGTGTWTLAGSSHYTGTTLVSGGVLNLTGTLTNSSTVDVSSGATLNLNGGTITAGTIHVHSGGTLSGTGTINATIINDNSLYNAWKNLKFSSSDLADPAISGDTADPNLDGISNLLAYALHLEPKNANTGGLPATGETNVSGNSYLTLNYTRLNWVTEISYLVEVSGDLATWNSGSSYTGPVSSSDNGNGTSSVVIQDLTPMNAAVKRFIRLKITRP